MQRMQRVVRKYQYDGKKQEDLFEEILKLREEHPDSEFFVQGTHTHTDFDDDEYDDDDADGGLFPRVKEVYGRLMQASDLADNTILINCNPWGNHSYSYFGYYRPNSSKYQIAGAEFSDPERYAQKAFLWIENHEVEAYEMHYYPKTNKEASQLLKKWDTDQ